MLEFPNGRALFDAGFDLPYRCEYEAIGSKGRLVAPGAFLPGEGASILLETDGNTHRETFPGINQWTLEFEHLSRSIVEGTPLDYDTDDAIKQQKVIDAVYQSTRSGQVETV